MFNHIFALAPQLIDEHQKPESVTKHTETEREKLVRQAQAHTLPQQVEQEKLAKYAA